MKVTQYIITLSCLLIAGCASYNTQESELVSVNSQYVSDITVPQKAYVPDTTSRYVYMWIANDYRAANGNKTNRLLVISN